MAEPRDTVTLTIGHSPDPDDAFMWWPLGSAEPGSPAPASIDTGRYRFVPVAADIEELNGRAAESGDLDITALSMGAYPRVADRYALTSCGSSMGDGYGPRVVARGAMPVSALREPGVRVAIPGERTTAFLTLRLMLGVAPETVVMPFADVTRAVREGEVDAGLVIHEAQITFLDEGLSLVADLGAWWTGETGLPLPLGANAVRRDLDGRFGAGTASEVTGVLRRSIEHALAERERGVDHALGFAQPGTDRARADEFIGMYVNDLTLDAGARGERGVAELYRRAAEAGLMGAPPEATMVRPPGV